MRTKTILIVDDDEDIRKILTKILSAQGINVLIAEGPEEAKKYLSHVPHVIITDLHMEPVDGFQFIRDLKSSSATKSTPILVLSALNDFASVKKAIALGVNDYIIKPLNAPLLTRKIKKVMFHQDFLSWEAAPGEAIETEIVIDAQVATLGESGYQLQGPFKITPDKDIAIESAEFAAMKLERFPHRGSQLRKSYQQGGRFINDITFIAIDEESSSFIRQFVRQRGR